MAKRRKRKWCDVRRERGGDKEMRRVADERVGMEVIMRKLVQ